MPGNIIAKIMDEVPLARASLLAAEASHPTDPDLADLHNSLVRLAFWCGAELAIPVEDVQAALGGSGKTPPPDDD